MKWRVNDRGVHDGFGLFVDATESMSRLDELESQALEAGVLSASARIEHKRYLECSRWVPTPRDSVELRVTINRTAKRDIVDDPASVAASKRGRADELHRIGVIMSAPV